MKIMRVFPIAALVVTLGACDTIGSLLPGSQPEVEATTPVADPAATPVVGDTTPVADPTTTPVVDNFCQQSGYPVPEGTEGRCP